MARERRTQRYTVERSEDDRTPMEPRERRRSPHTPEKQQPKPKSKYTGCGIVLLSLVAVFLIVSIVISFIDSINENKPEPEPLETDVTALIEEQAANILLVPTFQPIVEDGNDTEEETKFSAIITAGPDTGIAEQPGVLVADEATPPPMAATQQPETTAYQFMAANEATATAMPVTAAPTIAPTPVITTSPSPSPSPTPSPPPTPTPAPTPTPTPSPSPTPALRYGKTTIGKLNIRTEPDSHADRVTLVETAGMGVAILDSLVDGNGDTWYLVNYGRHSGYLMAKYIEEITEPEYWPIATRSTRSLIPMNTSSPSANVGPRSTSTAKPSSSASASAEALVGDAVSKLFHLSTCGELPAQADRVALPSRGIAITNGYRACSKCNP